MVTLYMYKNVLYTYLTLCYHSLFVHSYLFAKTTQTGLTSFYTLRLNSDEQTIYFDYRPEGLDEGFRTLALSGIDLSDGSFHHIAVSVFGADFALFVDGQLLESQSLIATLEDGPGVLYLGRKLGDDSRLEGEWRVSMYIKALSISFYGIYTCSLIPRLSPSF